MSATCFSHQNYLAFSNLQWVDATQTFTIVMYGQHDAGGFRFRFMEILAENINHEIHRRKIVVEQKYLIHGWMLQSRLISLGLRMRFGNTDSHACKHNRSWKKRSTGEKRMSELKCLLWDVDGTLADTERDGHRVAFNMAFEASGLSRRWDEATYGELLKVTGGKERIRFDIEHGGMADMSDAGIAALHASKTELYQKLIADGAIPLRPGVRRLLDEARAAGIMVGISTTTTPAALDALIEHSLGHEWFDHFAVLAAGDIVPAKKPAPDIYNYALQRLNMLAENTLALEDSGNGWKSAQAAHLKCVVTVNGYTRGQDFSGSDLVVSELGEANRESIDVLDNPHALSDLHHIKLSHLQKIMAD